MESPIDGKRAAVWNKKGIVALFNRNEDLAMSCWYEARLINHRDFDSTCNYVMHRWSTARINDQQMI